MSLSVTAIVANPHFFQQPITKENFGKEVNANLQDVLIEIDALTAWADKSGWYVHLAMPLR